MGMLSTLSNASEVPLDTTAQPTVPTPVQPITQAEIKQGLYNMQVKMQQRITAWGKTLSQQDFERTWHGRQLKKAKRQEICGIYQGIVNDTYQLASDNKMRLGEDAQKLLNDRDAFIQSLGFKDNLVDTQLGFNCRLR